MEQCVTVWCVVFLRVRVGRMLANTVAWRIPIGGSRLCGDVGS